MPATAATSAPPLVVLSKLPDAMLEIAKLVVVACVVVPKSAVKFCSDVLPSTVSDPFALSAPPTVSVLLSVDDPLAKRLLREERPETASAVEVAFVVVPLITERRDIEEEALRMIPTVVVGVSAPLTSSKVLPNGDEPAAA